MRKKLPYIALVFILLSLGFLYGFAQAKYNAHKINHLEITFKGNTGPLITPETVNKLLIQNHGNPLNQLNSTINLQDIEDAVQQHKLIKKTEAYLLPSGLLNLEIEPKKPIARVHNRTGVHYMDEEGKLMPLSDNYSDRVYLIENVSSTQELSEVYKIIKHINQSDFLKKQIIGITKLTNSDYQFSTRIGKHKVLFGKTDSIENKLKKLELFYKRMWHEEKLATYTLLNLKYKNQVVCTH